MNNLLHYRNQNFFESILTLLTDALPDNTEIQSRLDTLITRKSSYIKKTTQKMDKKIYPYLLLKGYQRVKSGVYE